MKKKLRRFIIKLGLVLLTLFFLFKIVETIDSSSNNFYIVFFTLSLIGTFAYWISSDSETYNDWMDGTQIVSDAENISIKELFNAFNGMDTIFGKPWMGSVKTIKGNCIIFGPDRFGEYVYIYKEFNGSTFVIARNDVLGFLENPDGVPWKTQWDIPNALGTSESIRFHFDSISFLPELTKRVEEYVKYKKVDLSGFKVRNTSKVFLLDEDFKWFGSRYFVYDDLLHLKNQINGDVIFKTFKIYDEHHNEKFRLSKMLSHIIFPHYKMYENGKNIGVIRKRFSMKRTVFEGNTIYGKLELRYINALFGENYKVILNGEYLGNISEKLNLNLEELIFDNFVLSVQNEKYMDLFVAMGIMISREIKRKRTRYIFTD